MEYFMNATTVGVDLAKNVFELVVADAHWKVTERVRLTRPQFQRWSSNRDVGLVVMEACGSAHHWARHPQSDEYRSAVAAAQISPSVREAQ
jgi:transposase